MGRLGTAAEVAALICWLASEECSFCDAKGSNMGSLYPFARVRPPLQPRHGL